MTRLVGAATSSSPPLFNLAMAAAPAAAIASALLPAEPAINPTR